MQSVVGSVSGSGVRDTWQKSTQRISVPLASSMCPWSTCVMGTKSSGTTAQARSAGSSGRVAVSHARLFPEVLNHAVPASLSLRTRGAMRCRAVLCYLTRSIGRPRDCSMGPWTPWQLQGGCTGLQLRHREVEASATVMSGGCRACCDNGQVTANHCGKPCNEALTETSPYVLDHCKPKGEVPWQSLRPLLWIGKGSVPATVCQ